MPQHPKTAIVVGASAGIGAACLRELARRGWRVAGVARREEELTKVCLGVPGQAAIPFPHDVTDFDEVPALFESIVAKLGGLGMIVYAAGVMPPVPDTPKPTGASGALSVGRYLTIPSRMVRAASGDFKMGRVRRAARRLGGSTARAPGAGTAGTAGTGESGKAGPADSGAEPPSRPIRPRRRSP